MHTEAFTPTRRPEYRVQMQFGPVILDPRTVVPERDERPTPSSIPLRSYMNGRVLFLVVTNRRGIPLNDPRGLLPLRMFAEVRRTMRGYKDGVVSENEKRHWPRKAMFWVVSVPHREEVYELPRPV